jgi:hypothetical protein
MKKSSDHKVWTNHLQTHCREASRVTKRGILENENNRTDTVAETFGLACRYMNDSISVEVHTRRLTYREGMIGRIMHHEFTMVKISSVSRTYGVNTASPKSFYFKPNGLEVGCFRKVNQKPGCRSLQVTHQISLSKELVQLLDTLNQYVCESSLSVLILDYYRPRTMNYYKRIY